MAPDPAPAPAPPDVPAAPLTASDREAALLATVLLISCGLQLLTAGSRFDKKGYAADLYRATELLKNAYPELIAPPVVQETVPGG